jgi:hypothetical protein
MGLLSANDLYWVNFARLSRRQISSKKGGNDGENRTDDIK